MSQVVILSGPSGAGKSAVAEALCARYDRTVHLETDWFFEIIRMGFINPMRPKSDRQNRMIARAAARAASAYVQDLYSVFIAGVIGPHLLRVYLEELAPTGAAVQFAVLLPSLEESLRRVESRTDGRKLPEAQHRELYRQFAESGAFAGAVINNTSMSPDQCADSVMDACGRGACVVAAPA